MSKLALIVDDNRALAEGLAEILESVGYEIRVFDDSERALRECAGVRFDVALLDVRMPGMDGVTLQQRLMAEHPQARFVLMTAYADDQHIAQGIASGVCAVLPKPVPLDQLFSVLGDQGSRDLLIVEDDLAFANALNETLTLYGYRCERVANARQARELVRERRERGTSFALALIEVRLPDQHGAELAHELGEWAKLPSLLMTSRELDRLTGEGGSLPEVLVKPFSADRLLRALAELGSVRS
jgi:DNA-binding response OmpR family regulator